MPESEPKPKLIELVGPGAGQGWKAVLKNGKAVVVHEIPVPAAEAAAAAPRLQRLFDHRHPALSPVLGWGTDANGVWVAVEPNEGTPLGTILSRGPLTPPAAAALGAAVLSGVAALHEAGIAMGGFNATAVRVTGNGEVRLAGHPAAAVRGAPSQSDLRADVRSCGMAGCAAFGVDPAGAPAPPNIPPGLVVTMRSMASGAMGPAADRAQGALREMASALLAPDRQVAAQSELALRAGGREVPPVTPFLPQGAPEPAAPPVAPGPATYAPRREETPAPRAPVSYEAPDRPLQTYSGLPAIPAPREAAPPPGPATPPATRAEPVPTWAEAPPRTPSWETAAPAAAAPPAPAAPPQAPAPSAVPPAPAGETFPPAAPRETFPPAPARETFPPAPARETIPPAPARQTFPPAPARETFPPAPSPAFETAAPMAAASAPVAPSKATNPPAPATAAWSPVEAPVWKPGETAAAGLGTAAGAMTSDPPAATATAAPPPAPALPRRPAPARIGPTARRPAFAIPSERPSWLVPAAVAVVILILLGVGGGILISKLRGQSGNPGVAIGSPSARTSPKTSATPSTATLHEVPTLAPATAGQVQSVQFCTAATKCPITGDTDTNCTLNGTCTVDVGVIFTTAYTGSYSYDIMYFDRCTGAAPTTLLTHQDTSKGFKIGEPATVLTVQLPSGAKSAALFVVTKTPAGAQSPPLPLGADSCA
jgi:hypothetical protein